MTEYVKEYYEEISGVLGYIHFYNLRRSVFIEKRRIDFRRGGKILVENLDKLIKIGYAIFDSGCILS